MHTELTDPFCPSPPAALGGTSTPVLERALRALLRVRGVQEMEAAVVQEACRLTGAGAAALYRPSGGGYELRASFGQGTALWEALSGELPGISRGLSGVAPVEPGAGGEGGEPFVRAAAALRADAREEGVLLLGPRSEGGPYRARELATLERGLDAFVVALQNAAAFDHLSSLVLVDPLTGCHNRRGFDEHLKVEMVRARRYRRPISLMVLDIDRFKQVNDGFGHLAGDAVLRRVGEVLSTLFRTTDVVCRFGGDEFAVIFPETPRDEVMRLAERLRARVAALYAGGTGPGAITISLGIAAFPDDARGADALLLAADRALYRAKAGGRNRVASA